MVRLTVPPPEGSEEEGVHWDRFYEGDRQVPDRLSHRVFAKLLDVLREFAPFTHTSIITELFQGGPFLEIGCGRALASIRFTASRPGSHFVGVDISPRALKIARDAARSTQPRCDFVLADARFLPFKDESFMFSWSAGVLEHIDDLEAFAKESYRTLRQGGQTVIIIPRENNVLVILRNVLARVTGTPFSFKEYWGEAHVVAHSQEAIASHLQDAGFSPPTERGLLREMFVEYAITTVRPEVRSEREQGV